MQHLSDQALVKKNSYINGLWEQSDTQFVVDNPATGDTIAQGSDASFFNVENAVAAAKNAFSDWSA